MNVSLNFRQAAYGSETGRVIIALISITHSSLAEPIMLSSDPTQRLEEYTTDEEVIYGTVSNGNKYIFLPMRIKLPDDTDQGPGDITLELDNLHRDYITAIRNVFTPVSVNIALILDNTPDIIEAQWPEFYLTNIKYDANVITGTLKLETLMGEPFPSGKFTTSYFPGIF